VIEADMPERLRVKIKGKWYTVEVEDISARPVIAFVDGERVEVDIESLTDQTDGFKATPFQEIETEVEYGTEDTAGPRTGFIIRAPMPGVIISVSVNVGDEISAGDEVCVMEAMKMQQIIKSDRAGAVIRIRVAKDEHIADGAALIELG
jgi:biotin carboxyl carrier protein